MPRPKTQPIDAQSLRPDELVRLECIRIAATQRPQNDAGLTVKAATEYEKYIRGDDGQGRQPPV